MKQFKLLYLALFAIILVSCKSEEPELVDPNARFSYVANDLKVSFTNLSTNASSYEWDFGNGKTSTEKDPTITYAKEGAYHVQLKAIQGSRSHITEQEVKVSYNKPTAYFTYKIEHPLKVVLTNKSSDATSYEWEFGDGNITMKEDPIHRYDGIGVYRIRLTAKNGTKKDVYETNVTIEAPTKCIFTGFSVIKIPNNNYYYQFQLTDDYVVSKTTYVWSNWFLLSSANLPYLYNFTSPKQLDISKKYVTRIYKSANKTSGQASGKGDYSAVITSAELKKYPEILTWSENKLGVELYFQWE